MILCAVMIRILYGYNLLYLINKDIVHILVIIVLCSSLLRTKAFPLFCEELYRLFVHACYRIICGIGAAIYIEYVLHGSYKSSILFRRDTSTSLGEA